MKIRLTIISLLALGFLAACSTATEEAGLQEVAEFYGGRVFLKGGAGLSTSATEPQGSYLEVDLNKPGIGKYFSDLQLPASNCAYLVYKHLRPKQRTDYNYFRVVIQDSAASHTYTFSPADLELATQSIDNLNALMFKLQDADFPAIVGKLDPAALGAMSHDSLTANLHRISQRLAPFSSYMVQGFEVRKTPLAGSQCPSCALPFRYRASKKARCRFLFSSIPPPNTAQFLCGLRIP